MLNILFIAYYFPPMGLSGVQRSLKFAKYLPKNNINPIVLTSSAEGYYAYDETLEQELLDANINVNRTGEKNISGKIRTPKIFPSYVKQKIGRIVSQSILQPDSKVFWHKKAVKLGRELIKEHNIKAIFATAPPYTDFMVAKQLAEEFKIPFVIDYRDSWVDNPFHYYITPFHKNYAIKLENDILKKASHTIVVSRYAKELILKRYKFLKHDEITIIPHGFDRSDFANKEYCVPNPKYLTITHSGLFQDNRTPEYLFRALSELIKEQPQTRDFIRVNLVGLMRKKHTKLIEKYKLTDIVSCVGNQTHTDSIDYLLRSDVLWLMIDDEIRTPGKLYEYFGAKKTLLITAPDGGMKKLAEDSGAAFSANPKDIEAIKNVLNTIFKLWQTKSLPEISNEYVAQFDREMLTETLSRKIFHSISY